MGVFGLGCGFAQGMSLALATIMPRLRCYVVDDERPAWDVRCVPCRAVVALCPPDDCLSMFLSRRSYHNSAASVSQMPVLNTFGCRQKAPSRQSPVEIPFIYHMTCDTQCTS